MAALKTNKSLLLLLTVGVLTLIFILTKVLGQNQPTYIDTYNLNFVLVHLKGESEGVTPHAKQIELCTHQIRLFNKFANIYLLTDDADINPKNFERVIVVHKEQMNFSSTHKMFMKTTTLDTSARGGFWRHASERFFYLADFALEKRLENIFFLEYDNLVYEDFGKYIKIFEENYRIGVAFHQDRRVIPGLMYFRDFSAAASLATFMADHAQDGIDDMLIIPFYRDLYPEGIAPLPIVNYMKYPYPLSCNVTFLVDAFHSVFDAAAYGQFLGGIDPRNKDGNTTGFINRDACYRVEIMNYEWRHDGQYLRPYVDGYLINSLHIHSKQLHLWVSDRKL